MNQNSKQQPEGDFNKALQFFSLVHSEFGQENIERLTLSFPQKYDSKTAFFEEFEELDDLERLAWSHHLLREAYSQYSKRDGQDSARKNILWTLMVCKKYEINLSEDFRLMKMIKTLWLQELTAKDEVKETLKRIFQQMGQQETIKRSPAPLAKSQSRNSADSKIKKSTVGCGCMGNDCLLY